MPVRTLTLLILCAVFGLPAAAQSSPARRQLLSVELKSDQLDITTDGPANFNSFKLRHPTRVVIDFPETDAAASERTLSDGGLITGWKIENLGGESERVARLTITLRTDSDYTLSSRTNDVEIHLIPATARPLVALEDERIVSLDPVPPPIATQSAPRTAVAVVVPHPVVHETPRSAVIVAHKDPSPKPVEVAVKTPVAPPQPAPIAHREPAPVKVAVRETPRPLPAPVVHHEPVPVKIAVKETPEPLPVVHHEPAPVKVAVRETPKPLPVVHHEPAPVKIAARETPKPLPAPVVHHEPAPVKIAAREMPKPLPVVHVAPPAPAIRHESVRVAVKDVPPPLPVVHVAPPPPAPAIRHEPVRVAVKDVPPLPVVHVVPPPAPVAPAPKVALADEPPLLPEVVVTSTAPMPVAALPPPMERRPRSMKPVRLGAIGFRMRQEGPEIILHTSGPVAYAMREGADNRLYLDIDRAEITVATDRLPLDTSYFDAPVVRIAPREDRAHHRVSIEIDLRAPAPYELASDGSTLRVRFPALPTVAVQGQSALSLVAAP